MKIMQDNCIDACEIKSDGERQAEEKLDTWMRKLGLDEVEDKDDSKGVNHDTFRF
jgi:hypothetical protein